LAYCAATHETPTEPGIAARACCKKKKRIPRYARDDTRDSMSGGGVGDVVAGLALSGLGFGVGVGIGLQEVDGFGQVQRLVVRRRPAGRGSLGRDVGHSPFEAIEIDASGVRGVNGGDAIFKSAEGGTRVLNVCARREKAVGLQLEGEVFGFVRVGGEFVGGGFGVFAEEFSGVVF